MSAAFGLYLLTLNTWLHRCRCVIYDRLIVPQLSTTRRSSCPKLKRDVHLSRPSCNQSLPFLVAPGMHSRWAALNRCHCELETDGNEGSLQSGSPAAVLCTRCQGVMTAQQGGTQRNRRQHRLPPSHTCCAKVQRGGVLAPVPASRNVKVEI